MKKIFLMLLVLISVHTAQAQKLIIGAKMPDLKGVQWLSAAPQSGKPIYLDFYQTTNATCKQNLAKIEDMKAQNPQMTVVLLVRDNNDATKTLVADYGSRYSIGYDAEGKKYEAFGVKFVPFSMIFDAKGILVWQGNAGQLTKEQIKGI